LLEQDLDKNQSSERISADADRDIGQPPQPAIGNGCAEEVDVKHAPRVQVTRELPGRGKDGSGARICAPGRSNPGQYRKSQRYSDSRDDHPDQCDENRYAGYRCAVSRELYRTAHDHPAAVVAQKTDLKKCEASG
jgi:hypothetical protein